MIAGFVTGRPRNRGRFVVAGDSAKLTALILLAAIGCPALWAKEKPPIPAARWVEGQPGCTFDQSDDGKYRYGLWKDDLAVILAIDSQELEKTRRRAEPVVGIFLTVRYRGAKSAAITSEKITLEFVRHFHVFSPAIDPDAFTTQLQNQADTMTSETEHEVSRHPEKKAELEATLQTQLKELSEMTEFLNTRSLRPARLDPANTATSGWVFFAARSKWIGGWKRPEEFLLRAQFAGQAFEFPITLPPPQAGIMLRRREP